MKFERYIAKRFLPREKSGYTGPLVNIATWSIGLGILVMIMAVCILRGFQSEIRQKVVGFGSHIVVTSYDTGNTYQATPISTRRPEVTQLRNTPGIRHLQFFASKGGMIKTADQIHGVIFKGVDSNYDSTFFAANLEEGRLVKFCDSTASNEVLVSRALSNKLNLNLGDKVRTYFWQGTTYRARAFEVCGIYQTDLANFDDHYVVGDIKQVQRLNQWNDDLVDGYELLVNDFKHLDRAKMDVTAQLSYDLTLSTIVEQNPALFSWLDLLDSNIVLIIGIMALVCVVAIISALLIMIFEKAQTIGLLKTLGASNRSIRRIFLIKASSIIAKGILLGDAAALALGILQTRFHIVKLDSSSYSMGYVPVDMNPWIFITISIGTLAVCLVALLVPTQSISRILPAKSLKFD